MDQQLAQQIGIGVLALAAGLLGWLLPYEYNLLRLRRGLQALVSEYVNHAIPKIVGTILLLIGVAILIGTAVVGEFHALPAKDLAPMNETPTPGQTPIENLRGFDTNRDHLSDEYSVILVQAPCDRVVDVLLKHQSMHRDAADILAANAKVPSESIERAIIVFQVRGHAWTQIDGQPLHLYGLAEHLSRKLHTDAFSYSWSSTGGGDVYSVYRNGEEIEQYVAGDGTYFEDEPGEENRREMVAKGFQINEAGTVSFFSKRGTKLNVESPEDCSAILDRVAKELGIFIAAEPFQIDVTGIVRCRQPWTPADFQSAKLLRALSYEEAREHRRAQEHADENKKLEIREGSDTFQLLQRILRGEVAAQK
jgi:hypothetical protein